MSAGGVRSGQRRAGAVLALLAFLAGCGAGPAGARLGVAAEEAPGGGEEIEDVPAGSPEFVPPESPLAGGFGAMAFSTLFETRLVAFQDGEATLALDGRGLGTDWGAPGRESAVVSVYLDGMHNQDLILSRGAAPATYAALLGPVGRGEHRLEIRYRPDLSAPGARGAEVTGMTTAVRTAADPEYAAMAGAPIVYARPDANRSDTPLLLTYERLATGLRYTLVATNEDGGTPAADLMAVWGRACDIDWVYREGGNGSGFYQGFLHRQLAFRGRTEGGHPVLRISTTNNMVSDQGTSRYKLRPPVVAAPPGARERILDLHPWAYKLTAQELHREGKIRANGEPESFFGRLLGKRIADPRRYVTVEFEHPGGGARLGFRLQTHGSAGWRLSTGGRFYRAIKRGGIVRTAIELPPGADPSQVARLQAITSRGKPYGGAARVVRAFGFDAEYRPVALTSALGFPGP